MGNGGRVNHGRHRRHSPIGWGIRWALASWLNCWVPLQTHAVPIFTPQTAEYILVGMGSEAEVGTSVAVRNFELGANTEGVPMTSVNFAPSLPVNVRPVGVGIEDNGDIAITHPEGSFELWNVRLWGETGIDCAGDFSICDEGLTAIDFNGPSISKTSALNGNVDLSGVIGELATARAELPVFEGDHSLFLDFSASNGAWDSNLSIDLAPGTTVIDFNTGGEDLVLENANLLIDGPDGAKAIFRLPNQGNFRVSRANLVVGNGGIGLNDVLFYTDKPDDNDHIIVDTAVINGVAFWDLSASGGGITLNQVQGCTQVVAERIDLANVRLNSCAVSAIPEPSTALLLGLGLVGLVIVPRRQRFADRRSVGERVAQSSESP